MLQKASFKWVANFIHVSHKFNFHPQFSIFAVPKTTREENFSLHHSRRHVEGYQLNVDSSLLVCRAGHCPDHLCDVGEYIEFPCI